MGIGVGLAVGIGVGFAVGIGVGLAVGIGVGLAVGIVVGIAVGIAVGLAVTVMLSIFAAQRKKSAEPENVRVVLLAVAVNGMEKVSTSVWVKPAELRVSTTALVTEPTLTYRVVIFEALLASW